VILTEEELQQIYQDGGRRGVFTFARLAALAQHNKTLTTVIDACENHYEHEGGENDAGVSSCIETCRSLKQGE
jgi:hypothetical protein